MKTYLHMLSNEPATAALSAHIAEHPRSPLAGMAAWFRDDLSIGPLSDSLGPRMQWFYSLQQAYGDSCGYPEFESAFVNTYIMPECEYNRHRNVLWHGPNAMEQSALRYFANQWSYVDMYEMDITSLYPQYRSTGQLRPEDIAACAAAIKPVDAARKELLAAQWHDIEKMPGCVRIWRDGAVQPASDDFYDELLLTAAQHETDPKRIIGSAMGHADQVVGDFFLHHRFDLLQAAGKI